jgi:hypothetical protein
MLNIMVVTDDFLLTASVLELVPKPRLAPHVVLDPGVLSYRRLQSALRYLKKKYREIRYMMSHLSRHARPRLKCGLAQTLTPVKRRYGIVCLLVRLRHVDGNIYRDNVLEQE